LWRQVTWQGQKDIAAFFEKTVSTALPNALSLSEMRFDWLDTESHVKLTMPVGPTLTCGRFERMCSSLDGWLVSAWAALRGGPPPPALKPAALPDDAGPSGPAEALAARLDGCKHRLSGFVDDLQSLEKLLRVDVPSPLNKIRYITEKVLLTLCRGRGVSWGQAEPTLENMIGPLIHRGVVPRNVAVHVQTIKTNASPGSHYQESALTDSHVKVAQIALLEVLEWFEGDGCPAAGGTTGVAAPREG
jgi:hypothetical protein